jgi:hypothetical protein
MFVSVAAATTQFAICMRSKKKKKKKKSFFSAFFFGAAMADVCVCGGGADE